MVSNINGAVIFYLLPLNAIFMAVTFYNIENVNIHQRSILDQKALHLKLFFSTIFLQSQISILLWLRIIY